LASFSIGLTREQHSQSQKKCFIKRLILFFFSMTSDEPFYSFKLFSRYYFIEISIPFSSSSFKLKSHNTQRKEGKYEAISSGSLSTAYCFT